MEVQKVNAQDNFSEIADIYVSSWKVAYQGIIPQDYLDALEGSPWVQLLSQGVHDSYVVIDDGRYIGTSCIGGARDQAMAGWGEIFSFYLLPEYFGAGYAYPLLQSVLQALTKAGYSNIYLWVLEDNMRARSFYEKNGFNSNGDTTTLNIGGKELKELRYVKHLQG